MSEGVAKALDSIVSQRLALLAGAGLSMAPPSNLPSANAIAAEAKRRHDQTYGASRPPLPAAIEDQAEHFFRRNELASVYFRTLVDQNAFTKPPNAGHHAVADLLLIQCIETAITTNVDPLIECAGINLFGRIGTGLDGVQAAALPPRTSPLLKIHGCIQRDPENTVWAKGQIAVPPVSGRIASSTTWLSGRLLDRDLLIVGFWTDWDYLNDALGSVLDRASPSKVILVDLADATTIERKAPRLYSLGQSAAGGFWHVQASGSDFLSALRKEFSRTFIRKVIGSGIGYSDGTAEIPAPTSITEPPDLDNEALWQMRRDLEGCKPGNPASLRDPPLEPLMGETLLRLRAAGAVAEGSYWNLRGRMIRVLRTANQLIRRVEAEYANDAPPPTAPELTIAVGAEHDYLPSSIVRAGSPPSIARGGSSGWITRAQAIEELGL
ncbi:hypothetical protein [Silanimonas sp.]|uniref:hypothetical protein n=1 Tax=Silanimonas sp. TaxID=1929290 RepID=UPI0037C9727C